MLNEQGTGITSARMQGFKSFFNIGNARQKNAETIVALHHAIMNDPRFGAQDVQAEAVRLLAEVHAERAISAPQIKDIVRGMNVKLPDGRRLSNDRALACDELAATYQPHRLEEGYNAIPEEFRLEADVSAGFTIQADAD